MTLAPRWTLPDSPDLDWLRTRAKRLRDAAAASEPEARELVETYDPPADGPVPLARAQRVLARAYGFAGWSRLREHIATIERHARPMEPEDAADGPVEEFLRAACLTYTAPGAPAPARPDPALVRASAHVMAACGDAEGLAALLAADPATVSAEGGPHRWVPLLYLCYSRIAQDDAVATLAVLLRAGADPNAGFLWKGLTSPFTALTGVLGGGERGEPPHPDATALATMLLEAGADPNDNQALYNRGFTPDDSHLPPLLAYGLGRERPSPWRERFDVPVYPSAAEMVGEHLRFAAADGFTERVRLLLAHGVDPDTRGYHPILGDRTATEVAIHHGHSGAARLLLDAGGSTARIDDADRLLAAAMAGDRDAVAAAGADERAAAVARRPDVMRIAAEHHGVAALELLAALGAHLDAADRHGRTALHQAAFIGDDAVCRWLLDHGADPTLRDHVHDGTPAGWARYAEHPDLAEVLRVREQSHGQQPGSVQ